MARETIRTGIKNNPWVAFYDTLPKFGIHGDFAKHAPYYSSAINCLTLVNPGLLRPSADKSRPLFIQGGFFPKSVQPFKDFCQAVCPESLVYHLDMNANEYYAKIKDTPEPGVITGRLEQLPITDGSVEVIILDYVVDYLRNEQLRQLADEVNRVLSDNGILLGLMMAPHTVRDTASATSLFVRARTVEKLGKEMGLLKLVYCHILKEGRVYFAYAKQESVYSKVRPGKRENSTDNLSIEGIYY